MGLPVQLESARDFDVRGALRIERAFQFDWFKRDFCKLVTFQDLAVHVAVPVAVAAVAAGGIHDDRAARLTCCRIEPDRAALQSENAANGVEIRAEGEIDFGMRRVELDDGFLGFRFRCKND